MIKVVEIELREIGLALKTPFRISSGLVRERRILLVGVRDSEGVQGWGECVAAEQPNYSPETIDTAWTNITGYIAPRILGARLRSAAEVWPLLEEDYRGNRMAKAALEMAIWELEARRRGVALARLLGGTREMIPVGISIGIQENPEALLEVARTALERGYRKIKAKIRPEYDWTFLEPLVSELGSGKQVMADANNAYTLADLALFEAIDSLGLMMIEQPLAWDDLVRHARLQRHLQTPICLDESITSLERVEDMIELGSGRIVNIKPGRVGGFSPSIAIHDLCRNRGIPVWCGGMLESGVGRAHNVALASLSNFTLPGDLSPSDRYWERDIVDPPWTMDPDGRVRVPFEQPGMGVELDHDFIRHLTVREERIGRS